MKKILLLSLLAVLFVPAHYASAQANFCPVLSRNLYRGLSGNDVRDFQRFLIARGFLASDLATGYFGPLTESAAKAFQGANSVERTGLVGPLTRAAIARVCSGSGQPTTTTAPTCSVVVSNNAPRTGEPFTVQWSSQNADYMTGLQGTSQFSPIGSLSLTETNPGAKTYNLTFVGSGGSTVCQAGIMVVASIAPGLGASPSAGAAPLTVTFTLLNPQSGTDYFIDYGDSGSVSGVAFTKSSTYTYSNAGNYTVRLIASGNTIATHTVTVSTPVVTASVPTCSITAFPSSIAPGESARLTWSSTGAESGTITGGIGKVGKSGTRTVTPAVTTNYLGVFSGPGGSAACNANVEVDVTGSGSGGGLCGSRVVTSCGGRGFGGMEYGDEMYTGTDRTAAMFGEKNAVYKGAPKGWSIWSAPTSGTANIPCRGVELTVKSCTWSGRPQEITCPSGYGGWTLTASSAGFLVSCVKGVIPPPVDKCEDKAGYRPGGECDPANR